LASSKPRCIDVDSIENKVYWYDKDDGKIFRANLDGTGIETLITFSGGNDVQGIALDTENGKIYWTDDDSGTISRSNLDGSSSEQIINQNGPWGIAVGPIP
jgi:DNA-binding beta-propeller fold protein YncE